MTVKEIMADEQYHSCRSCKYEDELFYNYPCNKCVCRDHWEHKEESEDK